MAARGACRPPSPFPYPSHPGVAAPILLLNGPKDKDVLDWMAKRDNLLKRWIEIGVYDPDQTWGKSANALQKIQMV